MGVAWEKWGIMRFVLVAGIAGLAVVLAAGGHPAAVWDAYQQLYPADPAKRQALDRCFIEDHGFDRFDQASRESCYRHDPSTRGALTPAGTPDRPRGNFVDLWRAAGEGRMPVNDVRAGEQLARFFNPAAAGSAR